MSEIAHHPACRSLLKMISMTNFEIRMPEHIETVFLDRDGVLNQKMPEGHYVTSWDEFRPLQGIAEAISKLNRAGIRVIVVSNQRGIALGRMSNADVEAIHARFQELLKASGAHIDAFYFCPHDKEGCDCRKPKPGLFLQAKRDFPAIMPETSIVIGDSLSDIEAGRNFGMATIWISGDAESRRPEWVKAHELADATFASLPESMGALVPRK
ncbi:D-glycero-alpha-D-manno-heptose-1,7-bisphosphate 7-phosphatase [Terracidiphilus gabretensis]|uniref:D-glycero-alpha-D-manno-heptose-1,7-bisphosphate 7-phosphatase n=1 Tax=Terracidiphilus gabretensis TaxID=1577687 RepID=UPI001E4D8121|nr:HAD family hydrolase [Terracidiphilus gabretensis]